jgi:hypothetical protein
MAGRVKALTQHLEAQNQAAGRPEVAENAVAWSGAGGTWEKELTCKPTCQRWERKVARRGRCKPKSKAI